MHNAARLTAEDAERAQALPGAARAEAAGCIGRGKLGAVVRRLEGTVAAAAWEVRGRVPAVRGGPGADVAAGDGLAADRAHRSGGGAGQVAAAAAGERPSPVRQGHGGWRSCPRFIHGAGPQDTKGAVGEGWATPVETPLRAADNAGRFPYRPPQHGAGVTALLPSTQSSAGARLVIAKRLSRTLVRLTRP